MKTSLLLDELLALRSQRSELAPRHDVTTHCIRELVCHPDATHRVGDGDDGIVWVRGAREASLRLSPLGLSPARRDRVLVLLARVENLRQNEKRSDGWCALSSRELGKEIGADFACSSVEAAIKAGLLETDGKSIKSEKCRWFRLPDDFKDLPLERVTLHEVVARAHRAYNSRRTREGVATCGIRGRLWASVQTLTIDVEAAYAELAAEPGLRRDTVDMVVDQVKRKNFFFATDWKTGRSFNNLTNMPRRLRRHARLAGAELAEVDVRNCQPVALASVYPDSCEEKEAFVRLVSEGKFYEAINAGLPKPRDAWDRERMKTDVYTQVLFGPLCERYESWKSFCRLFPILAGQIRVIKARSRNELPLLLQRVEADIMIGSVVPAIAAAFPELHFLTIHDSIAIPKPYAEFASAVIKAEFAKVVGFEPAVRVSE